MARPRSPYPRTVNELVREQRRRLYAMGHQNLNMTLSAEVVDNLDRLKSRYALRSRDAVVERIIRQCMMAADAGAFVLHAADRSPDVRRISPIVPAELAQYVRGIQRRFHGIPYGPVFEMIVAQIGPDLAATPAAIRLSSETVAEVAA